MLWSDPRATFAHPPPPFHPLLSPSSIPCTDLCTHPPATSRQTGGPTPAGHDARVSPTRDGSGMDGAAERAAALDAARTGSHHGPSPGSAARGRTGRGAPTCNSARLSECEKGEATLGALLFLIHNFDKRDYCTYLSRKIWSSGSYFLKSTTWSHGLLQRKACFGFDWLGLNTSSIKRRSWPTGLPLVCGLSGNVFRPLGEIGHGRFSVLESRRMFVCLAKIC